MRTVRPNISKKYSLHDVNIIAFNRKNDTLVLETESGIFKTDEQCTKVDGHIEFSIVDWDFSFAYLLEFSGNTGRFNGEKFALADFINRFGNAVFSVVDETFGYNQTKLSGYLIKNKTMRECVIEISHCGDMVYVDNGSV
ncbi:MAG: hypothetical protein IJC94_09900 [Oscillospiraceae bacterium]|nr:hypothetical protein [Oscillospiraceae bacterium]